MYRSPVLANQNQNVNISSSQKRVVRNLYRTLLTKLKICDAKPLLKVFLCRSPELRFEEPKKIFYTPTSLSLTQEARNRFRNPTDGTISAQLNRGFWALKTVNQLLAKLLKTPALRRMLSNAITSPNEEDQEPTSTISIENDVKAGTFLVAHPLCRTSVFRNSVVLITSHSQYETVGLILNKPMSSGLFEPLYSKEPWFRKVSKKFRKKIFYGGPGSNFRTVLHSLPNVESSQVILPGVFSSIVSKFPHELMKQPDSKIFSGFVTWSSDQLKEELQKGIWFISSASAENVFSKKAGEEFWKGILRQMGGEFKHFADFPSLSGRLLKLQLYFRHQV